MRAWSESAGYVCCCPQVLLFAEELASVVLTPFILAFSLPNCAGESHRRRALDVVCCVADLLTLLTASASTCVFTQSLGIETEVHSIHSFACVLELSQSHSQSHSKPVRIAPEVHINQLTAQSITQ
jgi:hypothetical protein